MEKPKPVRPTHGGRPRKGERYGGGRPPGKKNRQTVMTRELIEKTLGASPLEKMARLARNLLENKEKLYDHKVVDKSLVEVRARGFELKLAASLLGDVAQYHSARRKAIEITDGDGNPVAIPLVYIPDNGRDRPKT